MTNSGTLTATSSLTGGGVHQYTYAWLATAGGAVSQPVTLPPGSLALVQISSSGSVATGYAVSLTDVNNYNLLGTGSDGAGSQVASAGNVGTAPTYGVPLYPDAAKDGKAYGRMWQPGGTYTFGVANAGTSTMGTVCVYVTPGLV